MKSYTVVLSIVLFVVSLNLSFCWADNVLLRNVPSAAGHIMKQLNAGFGSNPEQMIICSNRFNCEEFCRKTSNGLTYKPDTQISLMDSHKIGLRLGRRNDCDKCALIYAGCAHQYFNFAAKFWAPAYDNMFVPTDKSANSPFQEVGKNFYQINAHKN